VHTGLFTLRRQVTAPFSDAEQPVLEVCAIGSPAALVKNWTGKLGGLAESCAVAVVRSSNPTKALLGMSSSRVVGKSGAAIPLGPGALRGRGRSR